VIVDDLLDALGSRRATQEASDLLRSLVEESEPRCGVLLSVSDIKSANGISADRVFSLTREGTLKPFSGRSTGDTDGGGDGGDVIHFPNTPRGEGSRGVGS
jgi:hypothetical protein